jgi:hypothetical protein
MYVNLDKIIIKIYEMLKYAFGEDNFSHNKKF